VAARHAPTCHQPHNRPTLPLQPHPPSGLCFYVSHHPSESAHVNATVFLRNRTLACRHSPCTPLFLCPVLSSRCLVPFVMAFDRRSHCRLVQPKSKSPPSKSKHYKYLIQYVEKAHWITASISVHELSVEKLTCVGSSRRTDQYLGKTARVRQRDSGASLGFSSL
jgi:hypothetical protein